MKLFLRENCKDILKAAIEDETFQEAAHVVIDLLYKLSKRLYPGAMVPVDGFATSCTTLLQVYYCTRYPDEVQCVNSQMKDEIIACGKEFIEEWEKTSYPPSRAFFEKYSRYTQKWLLYKGHDDEQHIRKFIDTLKVIESTRPTVRFSTGSILETLRHFLVRFGVEDELKSVEVEIGLSVPTVGDLNKQTMKLMDCLENSPFFCDENLSVGTMIHKLRLQPRLQFSDLCTDKEIGSIIKFEKDFMDRLLNKFLMKTFNSNDNDRAKYHVVLKILRQSLTNSSNNPDHWAWLKNTINFTDISVVSNTKNMAFAESIYEYMLLVQNPPLRERTRSMWSSKPPGDFLSAIRILMHQAYQMDIEYLNQLLRTTSKFASMAGVQWERTRLSNGETVMQNLKSWLLPAKAANPHASFEHTFNLALVSWMQSSFDAPIQTLALDYPQLARIRNEMTSCENKAAILWVMEDIFDLEVVDSIAALLCNDTQGDRMNVREIIFQAIPRHSIRKEKWEALLRLRDQTDSRLPLFRAQMKKLFLVLLNQETAPFIPRALQRLMPIVRKTIASLAPIAALNRNTHGELYRRVLAEA